MLDLQSQSLPIHFGIFAVAALFVWFAGTKLSKYVDLFADRTGLGKRLQASYCLAAPPACQSWQRR